MKLVNKVVFALAKRQIWRAFHDGTMFGAIVACEQESPDEPLNISRLAVGGADAYLVEKQKARRQLLQETNAVMDMAGKTPAEIKADRVDKQRAFLLDVMVIVVFAALVWGIVWAASQ